jgi:1-acyl-sn-glycerol-3-phosphate acyltransferase
MVIFRNIPTVVKMYKSLPELQQFRDAIDEARANGDLERERENIKKAENCWGPRIVREFGIDLHVYGEENIPSEGPVCYVSNHQGYCDIPCYFTALRKIQFGFVAKDDLEKVPKYGDWIKRVRSSMIKRGDPRASLKAILEGIEYIEQGFSMLIFPEGTRAMCSAMGEFKKGALKLAVKPGVPLIPLSINGTYNVFERNGMIKPARVDIIVHPPIETKGMTRRGEAELADEVYVIIKEGVEKLAADNPESIFEKPAK